MAKQLMQRYETYVWITTTLLSFVSVRSKTTWTTIINLKRFYTISATFIVIASMFNNMANHLEDVNAVTDTIIPAISTLVVGVKIVGLLVKTGILAELNGALNTSFSEDLDDPQLQSTCLTSIDTFYLPVKCYFISVIALISFYCITPLVFTLYQIIGGIHPVIFILPYPSLYPWEVNGNMLLYVITYIFESSVVMITASSSAGADCLFGLYILQMCGQFKILSHRVENLKTTDDYASVMFECIVRHQKLIHYGHCVENIYASILLATRITDAVVICSLLFQMNKFADIGLGKTILFLVFVLIKLLQQLMYGWFGSTLTAESEEFLQALYFSEWVNFCGKKFKNTLLFMMDQKPIELSSYRLFNISIKMFTSVMNASISYFCLLQTLDKAS